MKEELEKYQNLSGSLEDQSKDADKQRKLKENETKNALV